MINKILSLGDRIELRKPAALSEKDNKNVTKEHAKSSRPYISQIYDILDGEQLKIAMPIVEGRVIPLPLHGRFDACFFTSGGLYQSKVVITDRYKEDGLYILVVDITSELKKFQRRQYFRLEYVMDITYKKINQEQIMVAVSDPQGLEEILSDGVRQGIALDVSGGGMRFTSAEELEKDSVIIIMFNMGITEEKEVCLIANVISSTRNQNRERMFEHRVEFTNMKNTVRENLIKFIFETERRLRKKD